MAKDPTTGTRSTKRTPSKAALAQKVGKIQEDGSFGVKGGRVWDPDTGRIRKRK